MYRLTDFMNLLISSIHSSLPLMLNICFLKYCIVLKLTHQASVYLAILTIKIIVIDNFRHCEQMHFQKYIIHTGLYHSKIGNRSEHHRRMERLNSPYFAVSFSYYLLMPSHQSRRWGVKESFSRGRIQGNIFLLDKFYFKRVILLSFNISSGLTISRRMTI